MDKIPRMIYAVHRQYISSMDLTSSLIDLHVNAAVNAVTFEAIFISFSNRICDRERDVRSVIIIENMIFDLQLSSRPNLSFEYKYLATFHII